MQDMKSEGLPPAGEYPDVPREFWPVVDKYGREMFALVMNAGVAGQAASVLASVLQKHHSKHGIHAVGMLANAFNQTSNAYVKKMGWSEELVAQCDRDVQLAFAGKLVPPEGNILLLNG